MPDLNTARVASIPKTIVFVGLMGAGKSHIGRKVATALARPFVDSDNEVEAAAGRSISDIFAELGEDAFRDGERKIINRLLEGSPKVLATGGGAFINPETRRNLMDKALCVWLRADLDLLVHRTEGRTHRPLLMTGNPREILSDLMEKRYPVYAESHVVVDTRDEHSDITTERVLGAIDAFWQTTVAAPCEAPGKSIAQQEYATPEDCHD